MPPRKKTAFENFFSLKQHKRRRSKIAVRAPDADFAALRERIVEAGEPTQTRGSYDDLDRHFDALKREFSGQSALLLEHARLNVLLRRKVDPPATYQQLSDLWTQEQHFLLEHLNIRWMVSACDSVADWDPDPAARARALSVSLLVNTVKMAESERYFLNSPDGPLDPERTEHVQHELVPLFEGLSAFTIGTDDTLRNMRWRMEAQTDDHFTGAILTEVFQRLQENDTVYARFRIHHHRDRTGWW
jgi:hypothetical protein